MAFVRRVAAAAPHQVKVTAFGKTGQGRDLFAVIVSKDGQFSPAALHREKRPIVLIQNSIHAGEMDGKDSSLALLRDMVITKSEAKLLDRAVVVLIPIYNADGHERFGPYNRINQNGPEEMGWRVNAENLNLNRDYVKADAPETRAWLKLWNDWLPDFFADDHVTDGADYQYDVTYNVSQGPDSHPEQVAWVTGKLKPYLEKSVTDSGHVIGPTIFLADENDPSKGLEAFTSSPRFADGYVILQNRIGMLVEMHMLKDYKTRVTGNYEVLRALLEVVNRDADILLKANRDADAARLAAGRSYDPKAAFPLVVDGSKETVPFLYRGFKYKRYQSDVSGQMAVEYSHEPENVEVPRQARLEVTRSVNPPLAYIVPRQWAQIIAVLQAHGLTLRRTAADWSGEVQTYRCSNMKWQPRSFEGHHVMFAPGLFTNGAAESGDCRLVKEKMEFPAGSVVVPLDQRAAAVAIHWLEPMGPDSAMSWGFFDAIFEQKEYGEPYVLERLAREMMEKDSKLRAEFEQRVATDKQFAADPDARLNWFYMRSPWWDNELGLYPVGRLLSLDGIPLEK